MHVQKICLGDRLPSLAPYLRYYAPERRHYLDCRLGFALSSSDAKVISNTGWLVLVLA